MTHVLGTCFEPCPPFLPGQSHTFSAGSKDPARELMRRMRLEKDQGCSACEQQRSRNPIHHAVKAVLPPLPAFPHRKDK
jgi:hypothetical protein